MGVIIFESGMQFGEYSEEQVFQIEKSIQYTKKLRQNGIKSCEFILLRKNVLYFVEAKKTCPNQISADSPKEKREKYYEYIQEIVEKMKHSLQIYANISMKRYAQDGLSERMKDAENLEMCMILVVKNAEVAWLVPLRDKIQKELRKEMQIWKVSNFIILNEEQARKKHFII